MKSELDPESTKLCFSVILRQTNRIYKNIRRLVTNTVNTWTLRSQSCLHLGRYTRQMGARSWVFVFHPQRCTATRCSRTPRRWPGLTWRGHDTYHCLERVLQAEGSPRRPQLPGSDTRICRSDYLRSSTPLVRQPLFPVYLNTIGLRNLTFCRMFQYHDSNTPPPGIQCI